MATLHRPLIFLAACSALVVATAAQAQTCPDAATLTKGLSLPLAAVRFLADDGLGGRLAGSAGERCAGDYVASEFKRLGLRPMGENATYFQSLPLASVLNPHAAGGTGRNVLAALPGSDTTLAREWIVIGAHYDHLGEGGSASSLAPGDPAIHNGADDNASGVAAMLKVAERLAAAPRPARSVLFIAFTGEESGLLGSAHFVANSTLDRGTMTAMINMDMVGRLGAGPLIVYGVDTAEEWRTLLDPAAARAGVSVAVRGEGYGPSDHTSFYLKDVPVLHFFTNTHADYHKPSDDWQKIDGPGLEKVAAIVGDIATATANRRPMLTLRRGAGEPPRPAGSGTAGYGAYLGSVPDFTPVERGVKLGGVTAGSPADKAGLRAGDIILGIGSHAVADLQGMTDALRLLKPGETATVRFSREGQTRDVPVTLGSRATR
jgi:Peptidase family M28/PDZ domain